MSSARILFECLCTHSLKTHNPTCSLCGCTEYDCGNERWAEIERKVIEEEEKDKMTVKDLIRYLQKNPSQAESHCRSYIGFCMKELSMTPYEIALTEKDFCQDCKKPEDILMVSANYAPSFYICWSCKKVSQTGTGPVKRLEGTVDIQYEI